MPEEEWDFLMQLLLLMPANEDVPLFDGERGAGRPTRTYPSYYYYKIARLTLVPPRLCMVNAHEWRLWRSSGHSSTSSRRRGPFEIWS